MGHLIMGLRDRVNGRARTTTGVSRLLAGGASTLLALPLVANAAVGWFSRPVADDFWMAKASHDDGVFGSVWMWYRTWSGRWAHFLFFNLSEAAGRWTIRFIPGLLIALWVAAMAWAILAAGRRLGSTPPLVAGLLGAEAIAVATLAGARSPFLSIYWRPGVIAYVVPWILYSVAAGLVIRAGPAVSRRVVAGAGLLVFVAGGFYETQTTMQCVVLAVLCLAGIRFFSRSTRLALWWMLAASLASLTVLTLAPGNDFRIAEQANLMDPGETVARAWANSGTFLAESLELSLPALALVFAVGAVLGWLCRPRRWEALAIVPLAAAGAVFAAMVPSVYTGYPYPTPRVLVVPQLALVGGTAFLGCLSAGLLAAGWARSRHRAVAVAGLVFIAPLVAGVSLEQAGSALDRRHVARAYVANVDARDGTLRGLRAQGVRNVTLDLLPTPQRVWVAGIDVTWQRDRAINACIADYYGFDSFIGRVRQEPAATKPRP